MTELHRTSKGTATSTTSPALSRPEHRRPDCSLDRLTEALVPLLAEGGGRNGQGAAVASLLREYAGCEESWKNYVTFREDTYSRNLIWRCHDFELLLLCWSPGQESPIHDHAGQQCWMAVLDGELEEVHFATREGGGALASGRVKSFKAGGVAFIEDDIALHLIRPKAKSHGVSLHLYSNPIDACKTYCPDTGNTTGVEMGYHSVRGTDCEGTDPQQVRTAWLAQP